MPCTPHSLGIGQDLQQAVHEIEISDVNIHLSIFFVQIWVKASVEPGSVVIIKYVFLVSR